MRHLAALLFAILICSPAGAQTGLPVSINTESGCGQGKASEVAPAFCSDFDVANVASRDKTTAAAKAKCVVFYKTSLQLQNTFCSYQWDAVKFKATAAASAEAQDVGKANVSEEAVSKDNGHVATIGRAYMIMIGTLSKQLKQNYTDYIGALGKMNGAAGNDLGYESACNPQGVSSEVPGHLRMLLANFTWGAANVTYDSMWTATRTNYAKLRAMKEEAEQNAKLADTRAVEVGHVFAEAVARKTETDNTIALPSASSSGNGFVQYVVTKLVESGGQKLASGAGIVGAGAMIVFQLSTGQTIKFSDSVALFIGVLQPEAGLAAGMIAAAYQRQQKVVKLYAQFSQDTIAGNAGSGPNENIKTMDLMKQWGERTKQPACISKAAQEADCVEKRKTMQPYEHGPCGPATAIPGSPTITGTTH